MLSKETLELVLGLLTQVTMSPSEQDFEAKATLVLKAWKEANEALVDGGEIPTS